MLKALHKKNEGPYRESSFLVIASNFIVPGDLYASPGPFLACHAVFSTPLHISRQFNIANGVFCEED
jgi:hypothetical protein